MRFFIVCVVAMLLSACNPDAEESSKVLDPVADNCTGTVTIGGHGQVVCIADAADAGKTCQASSDCEGVCLADGQICSPQAPFYGCHDVYENGVIATLCVD